MTLAASRIAIQGETPHAHERAAIDFAIQTLPNNDPFHLWALLELLDPSTGRLHELDLLVLGYSALYVIEVKSGPGRYTGDTLDWYRTPPGEQTPRYLDNPTRLINYKAKILATRLKSKLDNPRDAPWVQPLVFLSAADLQLDFKSYGDNWVVTRETFKKALQFGEFPGAARARPLTEAQERYAAVLVSSSRGDGEPVRQRIAARSRARGFCADRRVCASPSLASLHRTRTRATQDAGGIG